MKLKRISISPVREKYTPPGEYLRWIPDWDGPVNVKLYVLIKGWELDFLNNYIREPPERYKEFDTSIVLDDRIFLLLCENSQRLGLSNEQLNMIKMVWMRENT